MLPDVGNQQPFRSTEAVVLVTGILHINSQFSKAGGGRTTYGDPKAYPIRAVVPFHYRVCLRDVRWVDPGLDGKSVRQSQIKTGRGRHPHVRIGAIEAQCLAHLTGSKRHASLQNPIVGARQVIGIAFPRPPRNQSSRRRDARGH